MKKIFLQALFLLSAFTALSKNIDTAGSNQLTVVGILSDNNYKFIEIINNKNLQFKKTDSLINGYRYWIKAVVKNSSKEEQRFFIKINPDYHTILYTHHGTKERWKAHTSSLANGTQPWNLGLHSYQTKEANLDTVYFKIDLRNPNISDKRFKASAILIAEKQELERKEHINTAWTVSLVVILLFFVNNLSSYLGFKDKTVLYYLVIQIASLMYLYSYWFMIDFGSYPIFTYVIKKQFYFYDYNKLGTHLAIMILFTGLIQLTRNYLNTNKYLPVEDKLLKYTLLIYLVISSVLIFINTTWFYIDFFTVKYDNIYCAFLILLVIYTTVKAYLNRTPLSRPFLLANLLPLFFVLSIPIYHVLVIAESANNFLLPVGGVISQALGFSIALFTRTRTLQNDLKKRELRELQLAFDIKEISYLKELKELELIKANKDVFDERDKNGVLQQNLELNQRELASAALNMVQKGELLTLLKSQIQKLNWMDRYHTKKNVEDLGKLLESNIQLDSEWHNFKLHFEQVHPKFFENLKTKHPTLTAKEIRLLTYLEMKLNHKEIAALLAIDPASVRRIKTRLLKKLSDS